MLFALKGFAVGFLIAAPVGPIGVLCIRRTLAGGRVIGFLSGLGAATADMTYGCVAAFGLTAVQNALVAQQSWLRLVGGCFLIYLGIRTFMAAPAEKRAANALAHGRWSAYLSTLGLTLTNPATIISFTVIFAGLRLAEADGSIAAAGSLVAGVFLGSSAWWLTLSSIVAFFRERFTSHWMTWLNRAAGTAIVGFGIAALILR